MRFTALRAAIGLVFCARLSPSAAQEGTTTSLLERFSLPSAVCADGTPGFFYMAANTSSNDYVFRVMGGGGCAHDLASCEATRDLSAPLFTSDGWPDTAAAYNVLSADAAENPSLSTYNRVFVPYCTQDLYLLDTESPDGDLQFRGRPFLEEVVGSVLGNSTEDARVVLAGSSAGGVGAFNLVNWVLDTFSQVSDLRVILDSAFFFDVEGSLNLMLNYTQENPEAAYSTECSEAFAGGPCCMQFGCMVQRGYYPSEDERLTGTFIASSAQDVLPAFLVPAESTVNDEAGNEDVNVTVLWDAAAYTGQTRSLLLNVASLFPTVSVFAPTCVDHNLLVAGSPELWMCFPGYDDSLVVEHMIIYEEYQCTEDETTGYTSAATYEVTLDDAGLRLEATLSADAWDTIQVDGTSIREAVEVWLGNASTQVVLFDSCDDLNCNPTCLSELLPGTRDESESYTVRLVVAITFAVAMTVFAAGSAALAWGLIKAKHVHSLVASALHEAQKSVRVNKISAESVSHLLGRAEKQAKGTPVLEWKALSFWLPPKKRMFERLSPSQAESGSNGTQGKQLLRSMHGSVPKGALCALMGPSGGGKTTLLDLLTGRKDYGRCEGEILFQGVSIGNQQDVYINQSGYMRQTNTGYLDSLTVLENLVYAAMLRFPAALEAQSKRVKTAIHQTSLERSAHTKAGGLSGGQKRRLKLAMELLVDRKIIFLDEPTSGLDASASLELVTILKRVSRKVTLIVAIHQPRPEVWALFSHAILLSGGTTVYCGPADEALAGTTRYLVDRVAARQQGPDEIRRSGQGTATVSPSDSPQPSARMTATADEHDSRMSDSDIRPSPPLPPPLTPITEGGPASGGYRGTAVQSDMMQRTLRVLKMRQWESCMAEDGGAQEPLMTSEDALKEGGARRAAFSTTKSRGGSEQSPATPDPRRDSPRPRAVPDKILDRLVMIGKEVSDRPQAEEEQEEKRPWGHHKERGGEHTLQEPPSRVGFKPRAAAVMPKDKNGRIADGSGMDQPSTTSPGSVDGARSGERTAAWKAAAVLLARASHGGYAKEVLNTVVALAGALVFIGISLRMADQQGAGLMVHLVLSVVAASILPVLLVYSSVIPITMHAGWPLTKLEIADGFYAPWCATLRYMIDHLSIGVFVSFASVSIAHLVFWGDFISALPTSPLGVNITISCANTLSGWVMIAVIDMLVVSGLSLESVFGLGNAINTIWGIFSGTVFLVSSIPIFMKAVTYSSPHYWATFFGLRTLLDGLDLTDSCAYDNAVYCAASYGDVVAQALDLDVHTTGAGALALVAISLASLASLAAVMHFKGGHVRIIEDLRQSKKVGDGPLRRSTTPPSTVALSDLDTGYGLPPGALGMELTSISPSVPKSENEWA